MELDEQIAFHSQELTHLVSNQIKKYMFTNSNAEASRKTLRKTVT